ncbi:MAG TPA: quinone-dependent dihydroorotate dehydrogenase [Thermoanaerobaculia bacterium]|nr:quinone-dependent dihydroorotate dehydrogenase [Thermoanaerobaculia bacterium]
MPLYPRLRGLLFGLPPERAHALTLRLLAWGGRLPPGRALLRRLGGAVADPVEAFGLGFANRVGLAAGYDKDGVALRGLAALGFGHLEVGTVTPRPQPGNPRPRVFRLPEDRALINRLGFPSGGAEALAARLRRRPAGVVLGVNLGKQRDTPLAAAADDYLGLLDRFAPLADYLAVNVSSPNTPGLRQLQGERYLADLLAALARQRDELAASLPRRPLLVKVAPDLSPRELEGMAAVLLASGVDGIVATNTTLAREGLRSPLAAQAGGLSGAPLTAAADRVAARLVELTGGRLAVIGVGGVMSGADAAARRAAGAVLVQLYTGLVYRGPGLVGEVSRALRDA